MKVENKEEIELLSINGNFKDTVCIPGTKKEYKIGWMTGYAMERLSKLELQEGANREGVSEEVRIGNLSKIVAKAASICILNGWKIYFFFPIYWRYLYYIKGYSFNQLSPIIALAKKKVPAADWLKATTLLTAMKITGMQITKTELESLQVELSSE